MSELQKKHREYEYVVSFIQKKVKEGATQTDIAKYIGKSNTFVNWLYLDRHVKKIIDPQIQDKIAEFFGITREEMLREGQRFLEKKERDTEIEQDENQEIEKKGETQEPGVDLSAVMAGAPWPNERRSQDPDQLIWAAMFLSQGIARMQEKQKEDIRKIEEKKKRDLREYKRLADLEKEAALKQITNENRKLRDKIKNLEETIELDRAFFKVLDEGITFFSAKREFIFSSNRHHLLDGIDFTQPQTIDRIILLLRPKILNFDEVERKMQKAFKSRENGSVTVELVNGMEFLFRAVPIYDKKKRFQGILVINTPLSKTSEE